MELLISCKINNFYIGVGGVSQPSYLVGNNLAPHCHWGNYWKGLYLMKSKSSCASILLQKATRLNINTIL